MLDGFALLGVPDLLAFGAQILAGFGVLAVAGSPVFFMLSGSDEPLRGGSADANQVRGLRTIVALLVAATCVIVGAAVLAAVDARSLALTLAVSVGLFGLALRLSYVGLAMGPRVRFTVLAVPWGAALLAESVAYGLAAGALTTLALAMFPSQTTEIRFRPPSNGSAVALIAVAAITTGLVLYAAIAVDSTAIEMRTAVVRLRDRENPIFGGFVRRSGDDVVLARCTIDRSDPRTSSFARFVLLPSRRVASVRVIDEPIAFAPARVPTTLGLLAQLLPGAPTSGQDDRPWPFAVGHEVAISKEPCLASEASRSTYRRSSLATR